MITLLFHLHSLRVAIPAFLMLGSAPTFIALWFPMRLITSILPNKAYVWQDDMIFSLYQRMVLFFFEHCTGAEVYLYGDGAELMKKKESVVYISNHQSTMDWVASEMLAVRQSSLGQVRYILKDGLRYFPLYGFYFKQHSCVYVSRNKKFNEDRARKQLTELTEIPFWLVIFPEGTRYRPDHTEVKERSQKFAVDNGLAVCSEVLTPRSKATWLSLTTLRGKVDALYDVTIAYSGTQDEEGNRTPAPGLPEFLLCSSPRVHLHVKRHRLESIPLDDETSFRVWLADRFHDKDRLLQRFYSDPSRPSFGDDGQLCPLPLHQTLPAFTLWMAALAPLLLTPVGRKWYFRFGASSTLLGMIWMMFRK